MKRLGQSWSVVFAHQSMDVVWEQQIMKTVILVATCVACTLGVLGLFVVGASRAVACSEDPDCGWRNNMLEIPTFQGFVENDGDFFYQATFEWDLPDMPSWVILQQDVGGSNNVSSVDIDPDWINYPNAPCTGSLKGHVTGFLSFCNEDGFVELLGTIISGDFDPPTCYEVSTTTLSSTRILASANPDPGCSS
jgi:hypothetical protein